MKHKSIDSNSGSLNLVIIVVDGEPESHELLNLFFVPRNGADNVFSSLIDRHTHFQMVETKHGHSDVPSQNIDVLIDKIPLDFTPRSFNSLCVDNFFLVNHNSRLVHGLVVRLNVSTNCCLVCFLVLPQGPFVAVALQRSALNG